MIIKFKDLYGKIKGKIKKENFSLFKDDNAQGSVELILIIGGILVIVLLVVSMYKSYLLDLGKEMDSHEIKTLNSSFNDINSRFE